MLARPLASVRLEAATGWLQPGGPPQVEVQVTVAPATGTLLASRSSTTIGDALAVPTVPDWPLPETWMKLSLPTGVTVNSSDCAVALAAMPCTDVAVP